MVHRRSAPAVAPKRSITVVQAKARYLGTSSPTVKAQYRLAMQTFFFDMKDGVPLRDRIGVEFRTTSEAIEHCNSMAKHFRDGSLSYDRDLEISVVNESGREIHREAVHPFESKQSS